MQYETSRNPKQFTLPNAIIQDDTTNWTSLHDAAANGDEKKLLALLAGKVDRMSKESNHGNTPLHEAASRGYSRCVKILCASPHTSSDLKDKKHKRTFQETREALHSSILDIQNYGGFSALHLAVQNGHNQSCRELLLAGTDPNRQNYYGDTALHTACRYGHAGACRILLSAFCDLNKLNVNGDSPLHISCAMGRHKITRILLEANCETNLTNAQRETPRDIAIRKNYGKILDILSNPHRMRNKREKCNNVSSSNDDVGCVNGINWSPYGCHYFPDPRSFPSPKLETLPKEPLKKGEQYFIDLAGHIRKGPIGIGNVCYCKPFFRHIEDEINSNQKITGRYVNYGNESLGYKMQNLAIRTNDQIKNLTRSMVVSRAQCESRRLLFKQCSQVEEGLMPYNTINMNPQKTLKRCRSLELLHNGNVTSRRLHNANSWDVLKETKVADNQMDKLRENEDNYNVTPCSTTSISVDDIWNYKNGQFLEKSGWHEIEKDYYNVSKRLGHLLAKTNVFLEIKKDSIKKHQQGSIKDCASKAKKRNNVSILPFLKCPDNTNDTNLEKDENLIFNREIDQYHSHRNLHCENYVVHDLKKNSVSCESLNLSQHLHRWDRPEVFNLNSEGFDQYFTDIKNNEHILQSFISAFRKDKMTQVSMESKTLNESEHVYENKLSYKDDKTFLNANELFQNNVRKDGHKDAVSKSTQSNVKHNVNCFTERVTDSELRKLIRQKIDFKIYQPITKGNGSNEQNKSLQNSVSSTVKKIEIKNSAIKHTRKHNFSHNKILKSKEDYIDTALEICELEATQNNDSGLLCKQIMSQSTANQQLEPYHI